MTTTNLYKAEILPVDKIFFRELWQVEVEVEVEGLNMEVERLIMGVSHITNRFWQVWWKGIINMFLKRNICL